MYNKVLSLKLMSLFQNNYVSGTDDGRVMMHGTARLWSLHDRTIFSPLSHRTDGCRIILVILGKD